MKAVIICVGDELLTGDTVNTNAAWLAKKLNDRGVYVCRIVTIPDDIDEIADTISRSEFRADLIFVMGGLGPTHDDMTREGVAKAVNKKLVRNPDAQKMLSSFKENPNVMHTADLPEGSEVLKNPVGVAPGFISNSHIIVLPGVPGELKGIFNSISKRFSGVESKTEWIFTTQYESDVVETLKEALNLFPEVKVGSYPGLEKVDGHNIYRLKIRLNSTNFDMLNQAKKWLEPKLLG